MARKNVVVYQVGTNLAMSANFTTAPTLIKYLDNCSYQINIATTDSTGSFSVEGSLDYAIDETTGKVTNPGNWIALVLSGTPTAAAANDSILIDLNQLPFNAIRLVYDSTVAGTGIANVYVMCRQLGG